jgi:chromosomal replication initiation ATPase DnaA
MKISCPCCGEEINLSLFVTKEVKEKINNDYQETFDLIRGIVCNNAGLEHNEFHAKERKKESVKVRKQFCYLAKKYTYATNKEIGEYIRPGFDHSTVTHAIQGMKDLLTAYDQERREMEYLTDRIEEKIIMKVAS